MGYLESISAPRDLRDLTDDQLGVLATEIRDFLVATCSRTRRTSPDSWWPTTRVSRRSGESI